MPYKVPTVLTAPRCKHMCCRDGVEKAPKPRKGTLTSASLPKPPKANSQTTLSLRNIHKKPGLSAYNSKSATRRIPTEVLDLTSGMPETKLEKDDVTKNTKQAHGSLVSSHRLGDVQVGDKSVIKTVPNRVTSQAGRGQLPMSRSQTKLQNTAVDSKTSSDYGGEWMDDLPSPSALLENDKIILDPHSRDNTMSRYGLSDMELEDTNFQSKNSSLGKSSAAYNLPTSNSDLLYTDDIEQSFEEILYQPLGKSSPAAANKSQKTSSLFMHTSSPEKAIHCVRARSDSLNAPKPTAAAVKPGQWIDEPITKRRKISGLRPSIPLQVTSNAPNNFYDKPQPSTEFATAKLSQGPQGIDPDLFAEFGDIVDFV